MVHPISSDFNRRDAIKFGTALATGLTLASQIHGSTVAAEESSPWIDAHSHIWSPDTEHYPLVGGLTAKDLDPPSFTDDE